MVDFRVSLDFICLLGIKCNGSTLDFNIKRLGSNYNWYSFDHASGRGGTVVGIHIKYTKHVLEVI